MYIHFHKRKGELAADAEMWQALGEGRLLREILLDFYSQVYADPRLSMFFEGVTIERAIDKQYSFLRSIFTGEKCYFGDHPKNAHHWMVISNALFNYHESLMQNTLRRHGLPEYLIQRWMALEEVFLSSIVKSKPRPRKINGIALPLDGYDSLVLEVSTLCDCCGAEIPSSTVGYYHRRTGKLNCQDCHSRQHSPGHGNTIQPANKASYLEKYVYGRQL